MAETVTMTTKQLAELHGVLPATVRAWVRDGLDIPQVREQYRTPGGRIRFVVEVRP